MTEKVMTINSFPSLPLPLPLPHPPMPPEAPLSVLLPISYLIFCFVYHVSFLFVLLTRPFASCISFVHLYRFLLLLFLFLYICYVSSLYSLLFFRIMFTFVICTSISMSGLQSSLFLLKVLRGCCWCCCSWETYESHSKSIQKI